MLYIASSVRIRHAGAECTKGWRSPSSQGHSKLEIPAARKLTTLIRHQPWRQNIHLHIGQGLPWIGLGLVQRALRSHRVKPGDIVVIPTSSWQLSAVVCRDQRSDRHNYLYSRDELREWQGWLSSEVTSAG